MELLERADAMLSLCEPASDALIGSFPGNGRSSRNGKVEIDRSRLTVAYRGKTCFLGNTLAFRFLVHLARRPDAYVAYEDLLSEVWRGMRTDSAVRSVAKTVRHRLRAAGLSELASAIDGSVARHYRLRIRK
ncbi:MAG: hypothetical protein ACJ8C4_09845 [Gemmataceae bacterium]